MPSHEIVGSYRKHMSVVRNYQTVCKVLIPFYILPGMYNSLSSSTSLPRLGIIIFSVIEILMSVV